ncbi:MAG: DUF2156 domain-containing protein [Clostridiales bacterium]|nr:DUF2156 domain-containing protein [Candidatus Crickella merdequi]
MIDFREVRLSDKSTIDSLICASGCFGADYSFANLYIWRDVYKPQIAIAGNRLIVATPSYGVYSYPKGGGDVRESTDKLLDFVHERGEKLLIRGLTDRTLEEFLPIYGDRFEIIEDRDNADYVYSAEKLRYLAGRKLASKRNHIKHFERNGQWEIRRLGWNDRANALESLTDSDGKVIACDTLEAARKFVDVFYQEKGDPDLESEAIAINEMFTHFEELGFVGGLLYQNEEPVAFTAATRLGDPAMDVHFEKALPGVEGAYTMINREFVTMVCQLLPEVEMFNREEDMGLEGLRKAKLSYKPDILMMKYLAKEK